MVVIVHRLGHNRTAVGNGELDNNLLSSSPWPVILPESESVVQKSLASR